MPKRSKGCTCGHARHVHASDKVDPKAPCMFIRITNTAHVSHCPCKTYSRKAS